MHLITKGALVRTVEPRTKHGTKTYMRVVEILPGGRLRAERGSGSHHVTEVLDADEVELVDERR